jgi:hypothetical protein
VFCDKFRALETAPLFISFNMYVGTAFAYECFQGCLDFFVGSARCFLFVCLMLSVLSFPFLGHGFSTLDKIR